MTLNIEWGSKRVNMAVNGDIYEEQAQCVSDIVHSHIRRGAKVINVNLGTTYYISNKGKQCLQIIQETATYQGTRLSFSGRCDCINCLKQCPVKIRSNSAN